MVWVIARKELASLFATPAGWVVLAILQVIVGTYFSMSFNQYFEMMQSAQWQVQAMGLTQFMAEGVYGVTAVLLLFLVPLVSMRLISEERKNQTMALLMSAPISMTEIIVGKLIGIVIYLSIFIWLMTLMILLLLPWVEIDIAYLLAHALGLWLLMVACSALGLYCSCLTANPILSGFCSVCVLSIFLMLDKFFTEYQQNLFQPFSLMQHYRQFSHGMINTYDVLFFVVFAGFFVLLSIRQLHLNHIDA